MEERASVSDSDYHDLVFQEKSAFFKSFEELETVPVQILESEMRSSFFRNVKCKKYLSLIHTVQRIQYKIHVEERVLHFVYVLGLIQASIYPCLNVKSIIGGLYTLWVP